MASRFERVSTIILVFAAVAVSGSAIRNAFFSRPGSRGPEDGIPDFIDSWSEALTFGTPIGGRETAPAKIISVMDMECPVCGQLHQILSEIAESRPNDVEVYYIHYPLPYHANSLPAAKGVECADQQGRAGAWLDVVFQARDSLGLLSWESFARRAGIPNTPAFVDCLLHSESFSRIDAGVEFGKKIDIHGTPTVIINGWRYPQTPPPEEIHTAIDRILEDVDPILGR